MCFHFTSDKKNQASLQSIQNSLFVLCLDKPMPVTEDFVRKMSMAGGMMLHGGGSEMNTGNRWFDKTLQVTWLFIEILILFSMFSNMHDFFFQSLLNSTNFL